MVSKNSISKIFQEWEGGTQGPDMTLNIVQVLVILSTRIDKINLGKDPSYTYKGVSILYRIVVKRLYLI